MTDDELRTRAHITDVLHRYCRGVDRMDAALTLSCFERDAALHYSGVYEGDPAGFVEWLWPVHTAMVGHSHDVTNILVDIEGDRAVSEAYVVVTLRIDDGGELVDLNSNGRYLDEWRRHPGGWLIVRRRYVSTLSAARPVVARDLSRHFHVVSAAPVLTARRDRADPSYELFAGEPR